MVEVNIRDRDGGMKDTRLECNSERVVKAESEKGVDGQLLWPKGMSFL